jgi:uncharacterized protein YecE (DUF72 family)
MDAPHVFVGIGGWIYDQWRGTFYPPGTRQKDELAYAASRLTAIEINATFYRLQTPSTFAGWAAATPDGFRFSLKASRFCTNRRILADAGEAVSKFVNQGLAELGPKLGPIVWQFASTKAFDAEDFGAFLKLLPAQVDGVALRHALEVRHESFRHPEFFRLAKAAGAAIVVADHETYPQIDEQTADFAYARLMKSREDVETGYSPTEISDFADRARRWSADGREAYLFFISGAKVRNPAAATALIAQLRTSAP